MIGFENNKVTDAAGGRDFTILVSEKENGETEVFGAGVNKFGQLGINELSDCNDFTKLSAISNLEFQSNPAAPLEQTKITNLSCGWDHCFCETNMGVMFGWGANSHGQLGNKRKTQSENPVIASKFSDRKLISLNCGYNSTGVVVEQLSENSENKETGKPKEEPVEAPKA